VSTCADATQLSHLAESAGIFCLPLPTPFAAGAINVYLIESEPLTLVDSGPNSASSLVALERMLAEHGHRVEDLGMILLTHQHLDHVGLAQIVAERSGALVGSLDVLAPYLADWHARTTLDDDLSLALMLRHGVDRTAAQGVRETMRMVRGFGAAARSDLTFAINEPIQLSDRVLTPLLRPGHSPGDTVFYDEDRRILLGGDHLLSRISSVALHVRSLDGRADDVRPRPLLDYRRSLIQTRALELDLVLGGHGAPIGDHRGLIDERLLAQDRRADRLLSLLAEAGSASAHSLALSIWDDVARQQPFLTVAEVLGHLDLLLEDGTAVEEDDGTSSLFRAA
jgi:glyoxylase-like metal-dependent hydrolase (beta-lactamase superfamily II)